MKKLFFPALVCLSVVVAPSTGLAGTSASPAGEELFTFVTQGDKQVLFDKKNKVYVYEAFTADGKEISLTEYKNIMEKSDKLNKSKGQVSKSYDAVTNLGIGTEYYYLDMSYYEEDLAWAATASPRKATPTVQCSQYSPEPCKIKVENAMSDSESFSIGVDAGDEKYIRAGASFTWETSSTSVVGTEMAIPIGKSGYITWAPYFNHTRGYVHYAYSDQLGYHYLGKSEMLYAQSPRTLYNGHTDGIWALVVY
jgi:hypothetical protein